MTFVDYLIYTTVACLVLNFVTGKMRLIALVWLYHSQRRTDKKPRLSVIICAKNEALNLKQNLPVILNQDYQDYEVIVVDDNSTDQTKTLIEAMQSDYQHLRYIPISSPTGPGKKMALKKGLESAKNDFVVLTDADCQPSGNEWLSAFAQHIGEKPTVIIGYGKHARRGGLLNVLQRYDTGYIAMNYMSKALWGYPYMGVGRNMGYSIELHKASNLETKIASGDDDLFVQAVKTKAVFVTLINKESFTISPAKAQLKGWLNQKARHTTTAGYYSTFKILSLGFEWLFRCLFYVGSILLLASGYLNLGLSLLFLNALTLFMCNGFWLNKLREKDLILFTPVLDFIYTFVQPIFVIASWARKKDEWN